MMRANPFTRARAVGARVAGPISLLGVTLTHVEGALLDALHDVPAGRDRDAIAACIGAVRSVGRMVADVPAHRGDVVRPRSNTNDSHSASKTFQTLMIGD